jgi:hypothetical protein
MIVALDLLSGLAEGLNANIGKAYVATSVPSPAGVLAKY